MQNLKINEIIVAHCLRGKKSRIFILNITVRLNSFSASTPKIWMWIKRAILTLRMVLNLNFMKIFIIFTAKTAVSSLTQSKHVIFGEKYSKIRKEIPSLLNADIYQCVDISKLYLSVNLQ